MQRLALFICYAIISLAGIYGFILAWPLGETCTTLQQGAVWVMMLGGTGLVTLYGFAGIAFEILNPYPIEKIKEQ